MVYQRRFKDYNDEQERQRRKLVPIANDAEETGSPVPESAPQKKQTSSPLQSISFKNIPSLYEGEGKTRKINPSYDTSIGQDMLAGAGMAVQNARGADPFFTLGAALGGLAGGALNKNLAGKQRHAEDVQKVKLENDQIVVMTDAQMRLEREKRIMEQQANAQARIVRNEQYRQTQSETKGRKDRINLNLKLMDSEQDPEIRQQIVSQLQSDGVSVSDSGFKRKVIKVGDYLMTDDGRGNVENIIDEETGQPITNLSTSTYLTILKKAEEISDYEDDAFKKAIDESKKIAGEMQFKTPTQKSTAVINIAKTILKNQGKKTGKVTMGSETFEIDIPQVSMPLSQEPKIINDEPVSPFMQGEDQNKPAVDWDGKPLETRPAYSGDKTSTQPPASVPRRFNSLEEVPIDTDVEVNQLPIDLAPTLQKAEAGAKGRKAFLFKLEGQTYRYDFSTKKVRKVK